MCVCPVTVVVMHTCTAGITPVSYRAYIPAHVCDICIVIVKIIMGLHV